MIDYVHMHNFQIHADKRVDFNKDITFITGSNGSGKSSVFRALLWVALNKGNSKQFRRICGEGGITDETSVEIGVEGHRIARIVSNTRNEYVLDGKKLTGFGRGVPKEVEDILRMTDLNVSEQFAPLFLVGDTSGAIADELASIVSLEKMEALVDGVNADVRKYSEKVDLARETKDALESKCEALSVVRNGAVISHELNTIVKRVESVRESISRVDTALKEVARFSTNIDNCVESLNFRDDLDVAVNRMEGMLKECKELESILQYFDKTSVTSIEIPEIDVIFHEYNLDEIEELLMNINKNEKRINELDVQLQNVQAELSEYKVCPLCGSALTENKHA